MKGYRTPSWFRTKGRFKEMQAKAQTNKPKAPKPKKERQETGDSLAKRIRIGL